MGHLTRTFGGFLAGVLSLAAVVVVPASTAGATGAPLRFSPATHSAVGVPTESVAAVDLNGDGLTDLVTVGTNSDLSSNIGQLSVLLNDGTGSFPTRTDSTVASTTFNGVAAGDLNGDGHADVVVAEYGAFVTYLGHGDGTLAAPIFSPAPGDNLRRMTLTDLNGDGILDAAAVNFYYGSFYGAVTYAFGIGDGTFGATTRVDLGQYSFPTRILAADVNSDGHPDLVISNGGYRVLLNDGTGTFTALPAVAFTYTNFFGQTNFPAEFHELEIADLDGNGVPDLIATESNSNAEALWFFEGNGDGTFDMANGQRRRAPDGTVSVTLADFDGDGITDVAAGGASNAEAISIYGGQAGTWPTTNPIYTTSTTSTTGGDSELIAPDVNNDGRVDLVTTDAQDQSLVSRISLVADSTPPVVSFTTDPAGPSASGWYGSDVTIHWSATDPTPSSGGPTQPTDTVANLEGTQTYSSSASCDTAGNCGFGTATLSIDKSDPQITAPADESSFTSGTIPTYSCSDAYSGIATCDATAIDGAVGSHTFTVTATDNVGRVSQRTVAYTIVGGAVSEPVVAGGTVTTDPSGTGATPQVPVQSAITSPVAGTVTVTTSTQVTQTAPTYDLIGDQLQIDAPLASVADPLRLVFTVDASKLGVQPDGSFVDASNLTALRDGVPITADCDPAAPGQAAPDPCVAARATTGTGDAVITILSSHASAWNFGHRKPPTKPSAPSAVSAVPGNGRATARWSAPTSNGGAAITGYVVTPYTGFVASNPTTFHSTAITQVVTGLTNGTTYRFKVAAINAAGTGSQSAASPPIIVGAPAVPTKLVVAPSSTTATSGPLVVSFTPGANSGSTITSYTATCTSANGGVTGTKTAAASPVTVTGLTTAKTYICTVKAKNARGSGLASAPTSPVVVGSPRAPTGATAAKVAAGSLRVSFTPGANNGSPITAYTVTCTSTNGGVVRAKTGPRGPITVTGLTVARTYVCTVKAANARGAGLPSAPSPATTA